MNKQKEARRDLSLALQFNEKITNPGITYDNNNVLFSVSSLDQGS
jgi:hypothetical protein